MNSAAIIKACNLLSSIGTRRITDADILTFIRSGAFVQNGDDSILRLIFRSHKGDLLIVNTLGDLNLSIDGEPIGEDLLTLDLEVLVLGFLGFRRNLETGSWVRR